MQYDLDANSQSPTSFLISLVQLVTYIVATTNSLTIISDHTVYHFKDNIATEAPDLSQTADGKWVMYISAVEINTIFVIQSDTSDPLSSWSTYGTVKHGGTDIVGYDAHGLNLPNGDRYLVWSTSFHTPPSISIIKLQNITHAVPGTPLSAVVVPDEYYEMNGESGQPRDCE